MFYNGVFLCIFMVLLRNILAVTAELCLAWKNPGSRAPELFKRQTGYHPKNNICSAGDSCQAACSISYKICKLVAGTALFCFNPGAGQTCYSNA
ncbi:hypothetical protein BFJ70_g16489 [Fusarium oxysporum]|nr:hypothetical protein BFJ70_g16489 [Fusarium oxysporum]